MLRFMGSQRFRHDWATELNWTFWKESYDQFRQYIKKQRHYFASQEYSFSSSNVWMWDLDYKESWVLKNWSFWTVVLKKTLESPLDCKEIQPVHPKGNQSSIFIGRTDLAAETPLFLATWCEELTHLKRPWCWEDWKQEEKGMTEDEMVQWHHWLNVHAFEQALGVGDAIQPSHPLLSPSPPALNLSQHQGLFKWVSSSHEVAKVLEF